jgi:hypothetical protein
MSRIYTYIVLAATTMVKLPDSGRWSATICVAPMVDVKDLDLATLVVDAVSDSILTAPGAPHTFERSLQRRADTMRFST